VFLPGLGAYVRWEALGVSGQTRAAVTLASIHQRYSRASEPDIAAYFIGVLASLGFIMWEGAWPGIW
jgi:hypothetical protein